MAPTVTTDTPILLRLPEHAPIPGTIGAVANEWAVINDLDDIDALAVLVYLLDTLNTVGSAALGNGVVTVLTH